MSQRVGRPFTGVLLVASMLAGCAGGNSTTSSAAGASTTPGASAASAAPSGPAASSAASAAASGSVPPSPARSEAASATPSAGSSNAAAGTVRTDAHGIEQVWVPAGTFTMGSDDTALAPPAWAKDEAAAERPAHEVAIGRGFWIDRTEVTNAAFKAFVDAGGYTNRALWSDKGWTWLGLQNPAALPRTCDSAGPDSPRACVTWFEAEAYAAWRGGALPTEAQWEYAARGPDSTVYPWGDAWDPAKANVVGSASSKPVGSYPDGRSWVGALDMAGNLMEWVADWYSPTYYGEKVRDDPTGPATGARKTEKGGWWGADPYVARGAYRHFEDPPTYQDHHIGVRVVIAE